MVGKDQTRRLVVMLALVTASLAGVICSGPASAQQVWIDDFNVDAGPVFTPPGVSQLPPPLAGYNWARGGEFGDPTQAWTAEISGGMFHLVSDGLFGGTAFAYRTIHLDSPTQQVTLEVHGKGNRADLDQSATFVVALFPVGGWTPGTLNLANAAVWVVHPCCGPPGDFVTLTASAALPVPTQDFILVLVFRDSWSWCSCSGAQAEFFLDYVKLTYTPVNPLLTALGPAQVWVGLKNSDDVGTRFDLLAEALVNGSPVGSGQVNSVPGGSSGFNNAILRTIPLALPAPAEVPLGATLSIRLSVRVAADSGHRSGTARLWFNDAAANSRFGATIGGTAGDFFLGDLFVLSTTAGAGPRKTIDVFVDRAVNGNPFKPFGTWSITP